MVDDQVTRNTIIGSIIVGAAGAFLVFRKQPMTDEETPTIPDTLPSPSNDIRDQLVAIAKSEAGPQEASRYWENVLPGLSSSSYPRHWCGAFTLWALHQVGLATDINWEIGKGYAYRLPTTRDPRPGDIAYFDQPYQHHAMVISANQGMLRTVDGNQSGEVKIRTRRVSEATAYYSIEPLLGGLNA